MKTDKEIGPAYDPKKARETDIFTVYKMDEKEAENFDLEKINQEQLKDFD